MNIKRGLNTAGRAMQIGRIAVAAHKAGKAQGEERDAAKRALANLMADARGVPMKVGQFLADRDTGDAFDQLVKTVPAVSLDAMLPEIETHLGRPVEEVFESIDESFAAASLGQVHKARLLDGTEVAVKVRYPDIAAAVEAELRLAGLMPGVGPAKKWGFDVISYKTLLKNNMDRELDYRSEAQRQQEFRDRVRVPGLVVPRVFPDLCGEGLLVQSWETGGPLEQAASWPVETRRAAAETLMRTFLTGLLVSGQVHCDPHFGNLFVRRTPDGSPEIVLLDFGCTTVVPESARLALLQLILGVREKNATDPLACFSEVGFDAKKLAPIADLLPALSKLLFEPFASPEPFSTKYWNVNERISRLLGEMRWWFRSAGPADLFLLMRAFSGIVTQMEALKIIVSWSNVFDDTIPPALLAAARSFRPRPVPAAIARGAASFDALADYLKVSVTENGRQIVQVAMPATQVSELRDLVPEDVAAKVQASNIDIDAIARRACDSGIVPQELFTLDAGARKYRVWLE